MGNEREFLRRILLDNAGAVAFIETVGTLTQVWDDLADGDEPYIEDVNKAFWDALVTLPNIPFYQHNFNVLNPIFQQGILDWLNANELEEGSPHDQSLAFVLRDSVVALVVQSARCIGGFEYAREVGPEIRRFFHNEPIQEYLESVE